MPRGVQDRDVRLDGPPRTRRVVITGFMCAGKTSVARELARRLSLPFLDLDDLVTAREGRTPQQLIDEHGEPAFRDAETRALRQALKTSDAFILALGGGAWTFPRNRALINSYNCLTVWHAAPFELCWERINNETQTRPLARDRARARELYDERRASYSTAELHVRADADCSAVELAAEVADRL